MIFVDSNVFVIALRYPRDRNARSNRAFLDRIAQQGDGVTSVVNVLETSGILSFNLNETQLRALFAYFGRRFSVQVLPEDHATRPVMPAAAQTILARMARRMSFGDALVAEAVERFAPASRMFVSWDAQHFRDKLAIPAVTPRQFLAG